MGLRLFRYPADSTTDDATTATGITTTTGVTTATGITTTTTSTMHLCTVDEDDADHSESRLCGLPDTISSTLACAQALAAMVVVYLYPVPVSHFYTAQPRVWLNPTTNTTNLASDDPYLIVQYQVHVQVFLLYITSGLICAYVYSTIHMINHGIQSDSGYGSTISWIHDVECNRYTVDNELVCKSSIITVWNIVFSLIIAGFHMQVLMYTNEPYHMLELMCMSVTECGVLMFVLMPYKSSDDDGTASTGKRTCTSDEIVLIGVYAILIYIHGTTIVVDDYGYKIQTVLLVLLVDVGLLFFPHMWDKIPTITVVSNARFCYVMCISVIQIFLYALWKPVFEIHSSSRLG